MRRPGRASSWIVVVTLILLATGAGIASVVMSPSSQSIQRAAPTPSLTPTPVVSTTVPSTTSAPAVTPTTTLPPSGWPVRTITSTGIDRDLAPTSHALYWLEGPAALSAAPVMTTPVRYDLVSKQVASGAAILGLVGSPALTVTGGWVWVVVGQGSETLAEQLDLTTLALHAIHVLAEATAQYPPTPVLTATVNGPLWVAAGENVWALSPTSGAVEASFTSGGAVASMSTDPAGSLLYVASRLSVEGGEVVSEYSAHSGRLLHTRSDTGGVGYSTVAATGGGVWVSVRTGNAGVAYELSSDGLKVVSPTNQGFGTYEQAGGVASGVSEGVLWLTSFSELTCADPNHGALRASEAVDLNGPVANDHVVYAVAPAGGVVAITPPATCWAAERPGA
jgi:hypothetical protein